MLTLDNSIRDARKFLELRIMDGAKCPCCRQFCKVYRHKVNSIMATGLIGLVKQWQVTQQPVHVSDIALGDRDIRVTGGQFALLRHWRLIEPIKSDTPRKRTSGYWVPTERGVDFALGRITVPKFADIFNNHVIRFPSDEVISIKEALGEKFNYQELMS